jgi:antitoxin (DNA-binding transcriptional repressor) of toxin-antitoxin stability system
MKSISVGELRQNPAPMIADLEEGEPYALTRHNRRIGTIIPAVSSATLIPRKASGRARTRKIARHDLTTASTIDELLNEEKGPW